MPPARPSRRLCGPLALAALAALALLGSCGGEGGEDGGTGLPSGHEAVAVIEAWGQSLSDGDVESAADYFTLPSVAENGAAPVALRSHADVVAFNRSLPCGARLVRARPLGRFIAATFRLIERPGGDCGSGSGQLARTAFVIRNDKIAQWRRLPDPPGRGRGSGPVV